MTTKFQNALPFVWTVWLCSIPLAAQEGKKPDAFENHLGWQWLLAPQPVPKDWSANPLKGTVEGGTYAFSRVGDDQTCMELTVDGLWQRQGIDKEYRGVAFDKDGKRYYITEGGASGDGKQMRMKYTIEEDTLPAGKVTHVGIEVLTPAGRAVLAKDAQARAKKAGVEVLPPPEIGKPFAFQLTTTDGKKISATDLRGKVVLIDGWATWCGPCMAKMPKLKKFYDEVRGQGFEIIGVNFDNKPEKAKEAIKSKELTWPQVFVPDNEAVRDLWREASTVSTLPRLLVLDRNGVLQADCAPYELEKTIAELLKTPAP